MPRYEDIHLDQADFRLLRALINEHCGIAFGMDARAIVERRLRDRLAALGLASFGEYYQFLRYDERGRAELDEAIDLVTINETYFFREAYQLRAYKDEILPALRAAPHTRERLSVWSAGCSTGEEVYSIAMVTRESGLFPGRTVRVYGSDISRRCLVHARRGVYGPSSFRALASEIRRRYFVERPDGAHVVDDLRSICQFGHLNLLDTPRATVVGRVDVIFCRNVLIYFDDASRRRVIDMFYDRLLPGGYLLLGHSESLLNLSTAFELVHLREDLVYRKPLSSTRFWSTGDFSQRASGPPAYEPTPARPPPLPRISFTSIPSIEEIAPHDDNARPPGSPDQAAPAPLPASHPQGAPNPAPPAAASPVSHPSKPSRGGPR